MIDTYNDLTHIFRHSVSVPRRTAAIGGGANQKTQCKTAYKHLIFISFCVIMLLSARDRLEITVRLIYIYNCRPEPARARPQVAALRRGWLRADIGRTLHKIVGLIVMSFADGRLFFFARSCRGGTGFPGRLMPAGHLLFCVTKKVAGNAIPCSRLMSERKTAHSRVSSFYPYYDTK